MRDVVLVVEGGGTPELDSALREAVDRLLGLIKSRVRQARKRWRTIPGGGRDQAYDAFQVKTEQNPQALVVLLVDSEAATDDPDWEISAWALRARKHGRVFFMVQCMEAWIVADAEGLPRTIPGLKSASLPKRPPEECSPLELRRALQKATEDCGFGPYEKKHGPILLSKVDPPTVAQRCPSARAFLEGFEELMG